MENEYIRERPLQEIIDKLMTPQEEEEEEKPEEPKEGDDSQAEIKAPSDGKNSALKDKKGSISKGGDDKKKSTQEIVTATPEILEGEGVEGEEEGEKEPEPIKFLENDYMEKAEMLPPKDPYGTDTMHADLIIAVEALYKTVEDSLTKTMSWLLSEKINYGHKV